MYERSKFLLQELKMLRLVNKFPSYFCCEKVRLFFPNYKNKLFYMY